MAFMKNKFIIFLLGITNSSKIISIKPHSPGKPSRLRQGFVGQAERGPLTPQQAAEKHGVKEIEANFGECDPLMFQLFNLQNYQAHKSYQKKEYKQAQKIYEKQLIADPQNPELNFNVGACLYKQDRHEDALHYFMRTTKASSGLQKLKEHAHFNAGNCNFHLKQYEKAIDQYDATLKISPENKEAKHNKELAKKKLEEQQQQQQQQHNNAKDNQENKDSQSEQKKQEKESEPKEKSDSSDKDNSKQNKQENSDSKNQEQEEQKKESQKSDQENKGQAGQTSESKNSETQDPHEKEIEELLASLEERDSEYNKTFIKANIDKGMRHKDGQKNW